MSKMLGKVQDKNLKLLLNYAKFLYGVIFLLLCLETGVWLSQGKLPHFCDTGLSHPNLASVVQDNLSKPLNNLSKVFPATSKAHCGFKVGYLWVGILLPILLVFCPKEEGNRQ